ncbi:PQQ-dependent sugar dehydrogenase [Sabulibacter ruber]|uniref:PQQ-dependent sugar dehydrogenase n=1 Tax=Sabulibacter ruber TaxID=2811901 RepID=UPI001A97399A|nr:PQQ-dependent sugar dehydrogenase [Sabulibacter ruber]
MAKFRKFLLLVSFTAMAGSACSQKEIAQDDTPTPPNPPANCSPLETRQANAPDQKPAFAGQTRACAITTQTGISVTVLTKGLEKPWAVEPLPDGSLLVTEKPGRLRIVSATGALGQPISGVPAVDARGQGGLLDVALSPGFSSDNTIFWSFSEPRSGGNATSVARGVLSSDRKSLSDVRVIFRAMPTYNGTMHYGSRLEFGPDGMLYVTLGERSDLQIRPQAQHMNSHMGKVVRITPDGTAPADNPFNGQAGSLPEIWTTGHRNVQASAFDSNGKFWVVEMGPQGGDELNLIQKGKNYGWPLVTYGEEYSGQPVPNSVTAKEGFEQPVYYWDPVIAPSGAQFYTGSAFSEWRGNLFVGGMKDRVLVRLRIENDKVTGEEHLLKDRGQRIRDVRQGADGSLYVVTDQSNGELWKISPQR